MTAPRARSATNDRASSEKRCESEELLTMEGNHFLVSGDDALPFHQGVADQSGRQLDPADQLDHEVYLRIFDNREGIVGDERYGKSNGSLLLRMRDSYSR